MLYLLLALISAILGETHHLEVLIKDIHGVTPSKLKLSNVKSPRPEAELEFDGSVNFPCTVRIPASINWDSIRSEKYILTTLYRESKLIIYTDSFGNFMSMSSVPENIQKDTISTSVDIIPISSGASPDTAGFQDPLEN